jgi:hypothetical protein
MAAACLPPEGGGTGAIPWKGVPDFRQRALWLFTGGRGICGTLGP